MRKALLFATALTLTLGACSSGSNTTVPNPSPSATVGLQVYRLGQKAKATKGTVTVYAFDDTVSPTSDASPDPGDRFVAIDAEGCAGPKADANTGIGPQNFGLQFKTTLYDPIDPVKTPALHQTVLASGRCARGWITFEIPTGEKPQYAIFRGKSVIAWLLPK